MYRYILPKRFPQRTFYRRNPRGSVGRICMELGLDLFCCFRDRYAGHRVANSPLTGWSSGPFCFRGKIWDLQMPHVRFQTEAIKDTPFLLLSEVMKAPHVRFVHLMSTLYRDPERCIFEVCQMARKPPAIKICSTLKTTAILRC